MEKNSRVDRARDEGRREVSPRDTWTQTMRAVTVKVAIPMTIGRVERARWSVRGAFARGRGMCVYVASHRARVGRERVGRRSCDRVKD